MSGYPKGALIEKIRIPDPHKHQRRIYKGPFLFTDSAKKREQSLVAEAQKAKLPELFAYFKIPNDHPQKWEILAMALAEKHVTGFQIMHNRGAPVKEDIGLISRYYRYFNRIKSEKQKQKTRKISDQEICGFLTKDKNFKTDFPELQSVTARRLQNLIKKARDTRRARIAYMCRYHYLARLPYDANDDDTFPPVSIMGDPPPWASIYPSKLFLRYNNQ